MPTDADTTVQELRERVVAFRDARDWRPFHNPKDLALAMSIEVAEILELFRFRTPEEIVARLEAGDLPGLAHELADVFYWLLLLSQETGVDLSGALQEKLRVNDRRYPVEQARGRACKYTELGAP